MRAELGERHAPVEHAPSGVIERLAWDDQIAAAGVVLASSDRLTTSTLVEIAKNRGQEHLFAISGRANLPEAVTDVIVDRGERKVIRKLGNNACARFSDAGFSGMVSHAEADNELTEILGLRADLPVTTTIRTERDFRISSRSGSSSPVRCTPEPAEQGDNLAPCYGLQFFGRVDIDGRSGIMTVTLKDVGDHDLWSVEIEPQPYMRPA